MCHKFIKQKYLQGVIIIIDTQGKRPLCVQTKLILLRFHPCLYPLFRPLLLYILG